MPIVIAADYHDDYGDHITAAWLRADGIYPPYYLQLTGDGTLILDYGSAWAYGYGAGPIRTHGQGYEDTDGANDCLGLAAVGDGLSGTRPGAGAAITSDGQGSGYGCGFGFDGVTGSWQTESLQYWLEANLARDGLLPSIALFVKKRTEDGDSLPREVLSPEIGQYVIVIAYGDGAKCGEYVRHDGREVVLRKARAIHYCDGNTINAVNFNIEPNACVLSREAHGETFILDACVTLEVLPEMEALLRFRQARFDFVEPRSHHLR
jgi:hypothetical protein